MLCSGRDRRVGLSLLVLLLLAVGPRSSRAQSLATSDPERVEVEQAQAEATRRLDRLQRAVCRQKCAARSRDAGRAVQKAGRLLSEAPARVSGQISLKAKDKALRKRLAGLRGRCAALGVCRVERPTPPPTPPPPTPPPPTPPPRPEPPGPVVSTRSASARPELPPPLRPDPVAAARPASARPELPPWAPSTKEELPEPVIHVVAQEMEEQRSRKLWLGTATLAGAVVIGAAGAHAFYRSGEEKDHADNMYADYQSREDPERIEKDRRDLSEAIDTQRLNIRLGLAATGVAAALLGVSLYELLTLPAQQQDSQGHLGLMPALRVAPRGLVLSLDGSF